MAKRESDLRGNFSAAQFYAEVGGHAGHDGLRLALDELNFFTHQVTLLGTYPAHPYRAEQAGNHGD